MCQASDGHIYIAGKQGNNPMIAKLTSLGRPVWVRNFPGVFTTPIELADILEDSDGMLVVCGTEGSSPIGRKVIAMRYDPATNNVLWYKRFNGDRPIAMGILEKGPGNNFILLNNIQLISGPTSSNRVEYWEIDRSNGSAVENLNYNTLTSLSLSSMVLHNSNIYGVGNFIPGNNSDRRPLFIKISPDNGLPEWAQETEPDTLNLLAKVFSNSDITFDDDYPVIAGNGQLTLAAGNTTSFVYLEKHAADGALLWMKRYEFPMEVEDVVAVAHTYYVFGRMAGSNQWGMFKTDENGNLLIAKELTAALPYTSSGDNGTRQNLMLPQPSGLLMLDYTWEEGDNRDILLVRTDFDFQLDDSCSLFKNLTVSSQNLSAKIAPVGLGVGKNIPFSNTNAVTNFQTDSLTVNKLCPECFPDPCHPKTFLKIFGRQGSWINISALRAAPDGNLYLAGLKDDHMAICKMAPDGQFLWTRSLAIVPSERITLSEIIVDSEGMIVGSGNLSSQQTKEDRGGFAFRYNPSTDQVIWAQKFNMVRSTESGILEKTPGGNFLLHYNATLSDVKRPEILELDRATGLIIPAFAKQYEYQYSQVFNNVVAHDGALYTTGYTIRKEGVNSFFRRMTLSKLDAQTGSVIWSQTGPTDWLQVSNFVGADLIVDGNSLITLSYGSETNNNPVGNALMLYLQKTTLDGEVLWVKKYNLLSSLPQELVATPDGYVIFSTKNRSLLKTDKDGNVLVSKQLNSNVFFFSSVLNAEQNQVEQIGQYLYFAHETARDNQTYGYTTLLKTDLNLNMEFECEMSPISIQGTMLPTQVKLAAAQIVNTSPNTQQALVTTMGKDALIVHSACPACSSQACTDLPDLTAHVDSITCSSTDGAVAKISICNLASVAPPTGFHLTFYAKNPLKGTATRLQSVFLEVNPDSGQCIQVMLPLNPALLSSSKVYTLVGVDNNVLPPIELGIFPFANGFAECDYANNLDSFEIKLPQPQKPDLGPDRAICSGQTTTLDAGSGYVQYSWVNGPPTQTYTVGAAGAYTMETTDACGRKLRDTVRITLLPSPKRSVDVVLLPGDSVTIQGSTYFGAAIVVDTVPSLTGGCDTVVTYTIHLDSLQCQKAQSFYKTIRGTSGRVVVTAADCAVYIGGENTRQSIVKADAAGKIIWSRAFNFLTDGQINVLLEDSEGKLLGSAYSSTLQGAGEVAVFRYDPLTDQVLWVRKFSSPYLTLGNKIIEKTPGGDYLFCYRVSSATFTTSEICTLQRSTGEVVGGSVWHYGPHTPIGDVVLHQGALYAMGMAFAPASTGDFFLMKIDLSNGNPLWTKVIKSPETPAFSEAGSLLVDKDQNLVATVFGGQIETWVFKANLNGDLLWLRKYKAPTQNNLGPRGLALLPDGYLFSIFSYDFPQNVNTQTFVKINLNGEVQWARKAPKVRYIGLHSRHSIAARNQEAYFVVNTLDPVAPADLIFGKFAPDGSTGENCSALLQVPIQSSAFSGIQKDTNIVLLSTTAPVLQASVPPPSQAQKLLPFTACSQCLPPCQDIAVTKTISFYPGDTITLDGVAYTQSDTVLQHLTTLDCCDSLVINILQLVVTQISLQCPANLTVTLPPNTTTTVVDYTLPTANTSCPNPLITFQLLQGPPVGGAFAQGATQVCYEASNQCGIRDTCCFTVTAQLPDPPCDLKIPAGCIRYELLGIRQDALGQRRYRVRMTNTCSSPLEFAYIQLPNGVLAVSPKEAAIYTAPAGNTYTARNPNASPFYSVRYKALTGSLNNGKSDIFEYTLPQQAQPAYIHVSAKLADGTTSETHLNTFYCPEVIENLELRIEREAASRNSQFSILNSQFSIWPNPTDGTLFVRWSASQSASVQAQVFNAQGQLVLSRPCELEAEGFELRLPPGLTNGLYYLRVKEVSGQSYSQAVRFVLER